MALTADEQERFLAALRTDDAFRAAVRREVLTDELLELPARIAELDARLTEHLDRLTEHLDRLTERLDGLTERLDGLTERLDGLTERLDRLTEIVGRQQDDVGTLKGELLESRVQDRPGGYLAPVVRKAVSVPESELHQLLSDDAEDVLRADAVVRGRLAADGQPTLAVVEVSWRVHSDDLDRALARAQLLARATRDRVLPVALSHDEPGDAVREKAAALGVALLLTASSPALVGGRPLEAA